MTTQIDTLELDRLLERQAVKVIDGSWALDGTDMLALYQEGHIPGAHFFDIEAISDRTSHLPHMAPSPEAFAQAVGAMGISHDDLVVVYDRQGLFSAARVWWTFTLMGHHDIKVLRGGLPAWQAAGLPIDGQAPSPVPMTYVPNFKHDKTIALNVLRQTLNDVLVLDARPQARFEAVAPEPRPGLRGGHMPGSRNLPFHNLIRDGALKPKEELATIFKEAGVTDATTVITSCGSGVTAAILSMALEEIGHTHTALYDGSWAEWGQATLDTPVVTGAQ